MTGATLDGLAIQAAARAWVGTPFLHRHRVKGRGIDCIGLVKEVGLETGLLPLGPGAGAGAAYRLYGRLPDPQMMTRALGTFLATLDANPEIPPVGAVAFIQWEPGSPMHVGIIGEQAGRPTLIHVLELGGRGCVEHGFTRHWSSRVASFWRYPGAGL